MLWNDFHAMSATLMLLLVAALFVAGLTKGIIGIGMPIVAVPLLSMLIDVRAAVMLLTMPLILSNIPQALEGGATWECFARLVPVLVGMVPGILLGVHLLLGGDPAVTKALAGLVIVGVAALTWLAPKLQFRETMHRPAGLVAGFAGGVLGGVAAMPGPLVFTYLLGKGLRGKAFTKEASLFLVASSLLLAVLLSSSSTFTWSDVGVSTAAVAPVALGMTVGQKFRDRISAEVFKAAVLLVVVMSGLGLVGKAITSG